MIMSMESDYVSELRSKTGIIFITQVIYGHVERWWNDTDRRKLLIRPPKLSGKPTSSHRVAKQEELAKEIINVTL
jgi:hypothetical protein